MPESEGCCQRVLERLRRHGCHKLGNLLASALKESTNLLYLGASKRRCFSMQVLCVVLLTMFRRVYSSSVAEREKIYMIYIYVLGPGGSSKHKHN